MKSTEHYTIIYHGVEYSVRWLLHLITLQSVHKNQTLDFFVNSQYKVDMSARAYLA